MIHTFDLSGKVVSITGGYGYLGKAATESLAYHNATVYVLGRDSSKFKNAFKDSEGYKKRIKFQECDVSNSTSIGEAFQSIVEEEGQMDVLINNAFYISGQNPLEMTDEDWNGGIDGTLNSVFRSLREAVPHLKRSKFPSIINVSSMYGVVAPDFKLYDESPAFLNPPHYGTAKAGVIQLTKYYASYLGKDGITVNTVTPGPFPSLEVQNKDEEFIERLKENTCLGRIGKPEELAGIFVFLSSNAARYITGQNFVVDGGWTTT